MTGPATPARPAPVITDRSAAFWRGGATGELRLQHCHACGWWLHPPGPLCPRCQSRDLEAEATSGRGTVWSFTVNRYRWVRGLEPPYVLAEVELEEQPGLRLLTAIVDCDDVAIGMAVHVRFEQAGDAWVPVFGP
ncbi:MAG: Zn-ribbon domain-containing OB-fold protein [Acidimicrobiales bacterium]